jgi:hypothetical protein
MLSLPKRILKKTYHILVGNNAPPPLTQNMTKQSDIPFILLCTMPKSATSYIYLKLASSLNISRNTPIANGDFPNFVLTSYKVEDLKKTGGCIASHHLDASPLNIEMLQYFNIRPILNLRDPRQSTLSWVYQQEKMLKLNKQGDTLVFPAPPLDYDTWPLSKQIDYQIEHYLKQRLVGWLKEWKCALTQKKLDILVTNYEQLTEDESTFFKKILQFYNIPEHKFINKEIEKSEKTHFRNGATDEWKTVFSQNQIEACNNIIGNELFDFYGWQKAYNQQYHEHLIHDSIHE